MPTWPPCEAGHGGSRRPTMRQMWRLSKPSVMTFPFFELWSMRLPRRPVARQTSTCSLLSSLWPSRVRRTASRSSSSAVTRPSLTRACLTWQTLSFFSGGRSPVRAPARAPPRLENDWLLAATWPCWFTWPLLQWLHQVSWTTPAEDSFAKVGTTYLELIANFAVVTHTILPAGQDDLYPAGTAHYLERPRTLRQISLSFVDAIRQLERLAGVRWLPARKTKCTCLRAIGQTSPRMGVHGRASFSQPERTFQVLSALLETSSVDPLLPCAREYAECMKAPDTVIYAYGALTCTKRAQLSRWLRSLRRTR